MEKDIFQEMADKWPSAAVARVEVGRYSGGFLNPKTMANMDSLGQGPERVTVGRKVGYPIFGKNGLAAWMRARASKKRKEVN